MSDLDRWLSEAEERCRRAKAGPWKVEHCGYENPLEACGISSSAPGFRWPGDVVQDTNREECHHCMDDADAQFMAAARTDLPRALRLLRLAVPLLKETYMRHRREFKNQGGETCSVCQGFAEWDAECAALALDQKPGGTT